MTKVTNSPPVRRTDRDVDSIESERRDSEDTPLRTRPQEHAPASPELSGVDADAAGDQTDSDEDAVGGSALTTDHDRVDELGAAAGLSYEDEEPLDTSDKLAERDHKRWELDPRSAGDA